MSASAILLASSTYVPVPALIALLILAGLLLSRRDPDARAFVRRALPLLLLVTAALALLAFVGSPVFRPASLDAGGSSFARAQATYVGHWRRLWSFFDYWVPGVMLLAAAWRAWASVRFLAVGAAFFGSCLVLLAIAIIVDGLAR
jgi:hypothetical protein